MSCPQIWNTEKERHREKEKEGDRPAKLTCNQEVSGSLSRCSRAKQRQRNVQKKCAARAKLLFG